MTQEQININEFNTLCAEYLGLEKTNIDGTWETDGYLEYHANSTLLCSVPIWELGFHKSWDCLMEVIDAIQIKEKVFIDIMGMSVCKIYCAYPKFDEKHRPNLFIHEYSDSKKEAVIQAIYNFLKYENNRNNN